MKKKVVIVQDNQDILNIMEQVLDEEGFDVTASLTTEPIDQIEEIDPDLLIVDDYIKGSKKGSQVIKEIKNDPETEDISAVLSSTSSELPQQAADCGADGFIEKPFDIDHLVDVAKENS